MWIALLPFAAACGRGGGGAKAAQLDDVVEWGSRVELEETPLVINVTPQVTLDPRGGFLIADEREGQVRRYSPDGRLLWHAGRRGSGPGEFRALSRAVRLPSGQVLAAELSRTFTLFDSAGGRVLQTVQTPFFHVEDMDVVDDSTLLVAAKLEGRRGTGPSLHLWDLRTSRVRRSFFDPHARAPNPVAATIAGWTKAAVRDSTIAAVFALSDTMYFFGLDGEPRGARPIPFHTFRPVSRETPSDGSDPVRRARWLGSFDYVQNVHWLPDGRFLIPFQSIRPEKALTRTWHLLGMDRRGRGTFEVRDVPPLLTVEPRSGTLYFVAADSDAPNRWTLAHLRR